MSRSAYSDAPWWASAVFYQVYSAQLRRRRRGRRRRPARAPLAPALPAGPGRRRAVDHAVLPLADGRLRLRRRRLPRASTPAVRHAGRLRRPARATRTPAACGSSSTSVPNHFSDQHVVVPAGAGRPGRQPRARALPVPRRPRRGRRAAAQQLAVRVRRPGVDPHHRRRRRPGQWYLHLFAPEQPDLNWEQPRGPRGVRAASCASGWTAASTASASTSRTAWPRRRACPTSATRRPTCT